MEKGLTFNMTSIELDHVFCFCSPALPEVVLFEQQGFRVDQGIKHQGQGTANRSIIFQENYLELIFLDSKKDAENNPLQLHHRAFWRESGASPFGIALRGTLSDEDRQNFWEYRPSYLKSGAILIHKASGDNVPLIFVVPPRGETYGLSMFPVNWPNFDKTLLNHAVGAKKISSVCVEGPAYRWPLSTLVSNISFNHRSSPRMAVVLDGNAKTDFVANETLSILF